MRVASWTVMAVVMVAGVIAAALSAGAQTGPELPPLPPPDLAPRVAGAGRMGGTVTMAVGGLDAMPVKGSPFCTTITTEHTQVFADGNRIHTLHTSNLCRDSDGRTRREADLNLMGAGPKLPDTKIVTIVDPVAGFRYMLDPENKIARRAPVAMDPMSAKQEVLPGKGAHVMVYEGSGAGRPGGDVFFKQVFVKKPRDDEAKPVEQKLGDQIIEGIHVTGTRLTTTIPSGEVGNEQPMVVTSESWYSPELKATVMTKHNDPWAGELKTQFTNVNTSQPDASLFSVPSDYKIVDEKDGPVVIREFTKRP
jgi:hypothetical protein